MTQTQHATLPDYLDEPRIKDMRVGSFGYTVPWMLEMTPDRRLWISPDIPLTTYGGTACLQIGRTKDGIVAAYHNPTYSNVGRQYGKEPLVPRMLSGEFEPMTRGLLPIIRFTDEQKEEPDNA